MSIDLNLTSNRYRDFPEFPVNHPSSIEVLNKTHAPCMNFPKEVALENRLRKAQDFFTKGNFLEAIIASAALLKENSSEKLKSECQVLLEDACSQLEAEIKDLIEAGQLDKANSFSDAALQHCPWSGGIQLQKGNALHCLSHLAEARRQLEMNNYHASGMHACEVLQFSPQCQEALELHARSKILYANHMPILERNKYVGELLNNAEQYFQAGRFAEATDACMLIKEISCQNSIKQKSEEVVQNSRMCMALLNTMHIEREQGNYNKVLSLFASFSLVYPAFHQEADSLQKNALEQLATRAPS